MQFRLEMPYHRPYLTPHIVSILDIPNIIRDLKARKSNVHCDELVRVLEDLSFSVRRGAKANHHTFMHARIKGFHGGNFDCGHGRNPTVKAPYVMKVVKVLEMYRTDLEMINE